MTSDFSGVAIVWDWNGTLLDDTACCVGALNAMLVRRGAAPVTLEYFRRTFSFPARDFYTRVGMKVADEDWDETAKEYHREYLARPAALAPDAVEALEAAKSRGVAQFVFSALRQDLLDKAVSAAGIGKYFTRVAGSDNLDGSGKLEAAKAFSASLSAGGFNRVALVGDSLHDADVAAAIGAKCILYGGGSHSPERLEAAAPVAGSLSDAVSMILEDFSK